MLLCVNVVAAPSATKVRRAYKPYMTKYHTTDTRGQNAYLLRDLNEDGVQELLIQHTAGVRSRLIIFTYYRGKVKKVLDQYGVSTISWKKSTHKICVQSSEGAAYAYWDVYQLKAGKMKNIVSYYTTMTKSGKMLYYKNRTRISENTYGKATRNLFKWKNISPLAYGRTYR